jgi:methanogenic corrinoid protein MtbC1
MKKVEELEAVCLSVAYTDTLPRLVEAIEAIREVFGNSVPIVVGGRAIEDAEHSVRLGADGWAADASTVSELIASLPRGERTA